MTLQEFLVGKTLAAVETFPDDRLINIVMPGGVIYGVEEPDPPENAHVTRRGPVTLNGTEILVDGLVFDTTQYTMLPGTEA